jgi:LytS/YehU family sensor histidine kinase
LEVSKSEDTVVIERFASYFVCLVLAITTFVIVGLYKFRFMGILIAYMVLSSTMLLGVMGGTLWKTVLDKYQLPCDIISYGIASYNFAGVGVIAIFYQQGVPRCETCS